MNNELLTYLPIAAVVVAGAVYAYKHRKIADIDVPVPAQLRQDILYGYYGTMDDQAALTKDYTNLLWEAQFQGMEKAADSILTASKFTVLDVANQVMLRFAESGRNYKINPFAEGNLRILFDYLENKGALKYVKVLTPIDEPNTNARSTEDVQEAINVVKKITSEYHSLDGVKLGVIYAAKPATYECIEQFDYVGVDDYDSKSQIFTNGTYEGIKSRLKPGAKTIILPGGGFGQDPEPFVNFAHNNLEVGMLVPFTYLDPMVGADTWIGLGNDLNPRKQAYIDVGKTIVGLNNDKSS